MLKPLALALAIALCLLSAGARAQEMRQFHAETATPLAEISQALVTLLPETVVLTEQSGSAFLSYTGPRAPDALQAFLTRAFTTLDAETLQQPVAISLVMTGHPDRTDLSLMVRGRFAERSTTALPGGLVIMDGLGATPCSGQLIVQHALSPEDTLRAYQHRFESDGFLFEDPPDEDLSFFIGSRPGCAVSLYAQGDAGGSTAVIRYLEE